MTDYKEEQRNELEALQSIYPEELLVDGDGTFTVSLVSQHSEEHSDHGVQCSIQFTYSAKYPDELPGMEICSSENLNEDQIARIMNLLHEQAEENKGMVMVFTLVSAVQEHLSVLADENVRLELESKQRKLQAEEEAERRKFEGTRVTIENFMAWKAKFDVDVAEAKRLKKLKETEHLKPTGYELFMKDKTLDDSDLKFLDESDSGTVAVDESLFADLDDLDLEDELLDS